MEAKIPTVLLPKIGEPAHTVKKSALKDNQTRLETEMLERLIDWVSKGTKLTVLADRGFCKAELYECCALLGIDYAFRFREVILVTARRGIAAPRQSFSCQMGARECSCLRG